MTLPKQFGMRKLTGKTTFVFLLFFFFIDGILIEFAENLAQSEHLINNAVFEIFADNFLDLNI